MNILGSGPQRTLLGIMMAGCPNTNTFTWCYLPGNLDPLQILLYIFSLVNYCPGTEGNFNWSCWGNTDTHTLRAPIRFSAKKPRTLTILFPVHTEIPIYSTWLSLRKFTLKNKNLLNGETGWGRTLRFPLRFVISFGILGANCYIFLCPCFLTCKGWPQGLFHF